MVDAAFTVAENCCCDEDACGPSDWETQADMDSGSTGTPDLPSVSVDADWQVTGTLPAHLDCGGTSVYLSARTYARRGFRLNASVLVTLAMDGQWSGDSSNSTAYLAIKKCEDDTNALLLELAGPATAGSPCELSDASASTNGIVAAGDYYIEYSVVRHDPGSESSLTGTVSGLNGTNVIDPPCCEPQVIYEFVSLANTTDLTSFFTDPFPGFGANGTQDTGAMQWVLIEVGENVLYGTGTVGVDGVLQPPSPLADCSDPFVGAVLCNDSGTVKFISDYPYNGYLVLAICCARGGGADIYCPPGIFPPP